MTSDLRIRDLEAGDIAALQDIDRAAHGDPWSQRAFQADIDQTDRLHMVLDRDGTVLGHASVWVDGASCRVTNVAVAGDHAGQGHATALLHSVIERALDHPGVRNLQLEVRAANRRAQRLYSRFGFQPVGIERNFYDRADNRGSRDAVVMAVPDVCSDDWRTRLASIAHDNPTLDATHQPDRRQDPT